MGKEELKAKAENKNFFISYSDKRIGMLMLENKI
jgi:hypothetical protein